MSTSSNKPSKLTPEEKMTQLMLEASHVEGEKAGLTSLRQGLDSRIEHLKKHSRKLNAEIDAALKKLTKKGPKIVLPQGFDNRGPVG